MKSSDIVQYDETTVNSNYENMEVNSETVEESQQSTSCNENENVQQDVVNDDGLDN